MSSVGNLNHGDSAAVLTANYQMWRVKACVMRLDAT